MASPPRAGPNASGTWQPLGPAPVGPPYLFGGFYGGVNSGRITGLTVIPSGAHAGRVVAASAGGGMWTSDDNGTTWTARSDNAATLATGSVTVDPSNPNHLIAGTGEANQSGDSAYGLGILSSTDGGTSWSLSDPGGVFFGAHIAQVAIDPSNSSHMFAATNQGLYVTSNAGASWAKPTDTSYAGVGGNITAVVIDLSTPSTVYIGGGVATVAKSTDGGVHWTAVNSGITLPNASHAPYTALAIAAPAPSTLYASVGSTDPGALYRTTNGAASWSQVSAPDYTNGGYAYTGTTSSGGAGDYDNAVAVDPTNPSHVLAGGVTVVETTNGGTTWSNLNGQPFFGGGTNLLHPDQHALAFGPDGKVWIGNDGGVYRYAPSTQTMTDENGNLDITQFYFGFNEVGGTLLAGSQDNGSARTSSSSLGAWTGIWAGDGGPSTITPNDTSLQFIEADSHLYVTTDAFASVFRDITPSAVGSFTTPMIVVPNPSTPSNPTVFYGGPDLYRTTDPTAGTPTWTKVTSVGTYVSAIAAAPSNPNVVYVAFENGTVEVSTDGGLTFTILASQPFSETWATGLSVDPSNPKAITGSFSYYWVRPGIGDPHVAQYSYSTSPGTGTWTVITGNLPPTGAVSRVVYDGGSLVAATDAGVYGTSTPAGPSTTWTLEGSGLPAVQVQDLYVDSGTGNMYALTHGRGAWMCTLCGPAPPPPLGFHIVTTALRNATRGVAYRVQLQATGGATPYKWKRIGRLPKGLKLSKTGLLAGTPGATDKAGTYTFTVQATTKKSKGHPAQTARQPLALTLS